MHHLVERQFARLVQLESFCTQPYFRGLDEKVWATTIKNGFERSFVLNLGKRYCEKGVALGSTRQGGLVTYRIIRFCPHRPESQNLNRLRFFSSVKATGRFICKGRFGLPADPLLNESYSIISNY